MNAIQLDECMDCKRLVRSCSKQDLVEVIRFPRKLKTKEARMRSQNKDGTILPRFFAEGSTLLTSDFPIDSDNLSVIPDFHPGIIIISNVHPTPNVDFSDIEKTIENFKSEIPTWHSALWANSIVEITLDWLEVRHVERGKLNVRPRIEFKDPTCKSQFLEWLTANAQRHA
ncbi:MAG TPA: hypothetical protein VK395_27605 [Gemmataceae bacterium]|nr:hypothetical protein [Gemmataceae bacterium]